MTIRLNGEAREIAARSISELLQEIGMPVQGVAVALNARVVRRADHAATTLQEGDEIEIIRAVQGG